MKAKIVSLLDYYSMKFSSKRKNKIIKELLDDDCTTS